MISQLRTGQQVEAKYARVLKNLLWVNLGLLVVVQILSFMVRDAEEVTPLIQFVLAMIVPLLLLSIGTGIVWLMWTYRVYDNLRRVGSRQTAMTPGWAVGWWFVPIANLWMPYKIMREISARSEISNDYELLNGSPIGIVEWWALFVISNFVGRLSARSENLPLELISFALDLAYYLYAIKVVRVVSSLQQTMRNPTPVQANLAQL